MSDIQSAIDISHDTIAEGFSVGDRIFPCDDEQKKALKTAINAMKKQIRQKPVRVTVGNKDGTDGCPICQREFYEAFNFCPDCGQALDWGDEPENEGEGV